MIGEPPHNASIIDQLADIFERWGAEVYLGEDVTIAHHMLQCAALAEAEGAPDSLVVAALLHDIGYFTEAGAASEASATGNRHEAAGAAFLQALCPMVISETIRMHVAAKRYLCATVPAYHARLSAESQHSLAFQGGPMTAAEIAHFRSLAFHQEAIRVRLWDDAGKEIGLRTRSFAAYRPLLQSVFGAPASRAG